MSFMPYIIALAFGIFPIASHLNPGFAEGNSQSGFWVSTCLGGSVFIELGGKTPNPENPKKEAHACHATCREENPLAKLLSAD